MIITETNTIKKNDRVVIIIPTLNEEKFILKCLDSIHSQTYPAALTNILVVDGGSTDKTCDIVKNMSQTHTNIHLLHNPKKIQSIAFNIGVENSDEPYIVRLDAHATYDKKYVERCLKLLIKNPNFGNVGGRLIIVPQQKKYISEANAILNQSKFGIGGAAFRIGTEAGFADTVPFGAFPRKMIQKIGGMREDLARGEDNEYNSRIRKNGYDIYFDPAILSYYYARDRISTSAKQMYLNGESIAKLLFIDKHSVGLRHLIPLFFVLALIGSLTLSLISKFFLFFFFITLGLYIIINVLSSIKECMKFGSKYIFILPVFFFIVHVSYGTGTIIGVLKSSTPKKQNL